MKKGLFLLLTLAFPLFVNAQTVDIVYEATTYTPPFYQGLPLWSKQSEISFTAIVTGVSNPKSLYYLWKRDGTALGLVSGRGVDKLTFSDTVFGKPKTIAVEISTADETIIAEASVTLAPQDPELLIYENNPLYGYLFNWEVGGEYPMRGEEITLGAFPLYFFSPIRESGGLQYSWGRREASATPDITYRRGEESGRASISLETVHRDFLHQRGERGFVLNFGSEKDE